jgi:hypothetical protein
MSIDKLTGLEKLDLSRWLKLKELPTSIENLLPFNPWTCQGVHS